MDIPFRKGDHVAVTSGRCAGQQGEVLFAGIAKHHGNQALVCILTTRGDRLWVEPARVTFTDREARWRVVLDLRARVEVLEHALAQLAVTAAGRQIPLPLADADQMALPLGRSA